MFDDSVRSVKAAHNANSAAIGTAALADLREKAGQQAKKARP
jgi:beta-phosphoglucomutase-like phosphatase (HAD superfamily)